MTTRLALKIAATGLIVLCGTLPAGAETFVYVSNANDGTIATFRMLEGGVLEPGATIEVAELVMPLAVSPDRTILYAGVRSKPFGVHSYAIDQTTGALSHLSSAPLPDNMLYLSTDRTGKYLFSTSNSGDLVAVNALGSDGSVSGEPIQVIETGDDAHAILNRWIQSLRLHANARRGCGRAVQPSTRRLAGSLPTIPARCRQARPRGRGIS
jgi:6-phosphogluconolactonase